MNIVEASEHVVKQMEQQKSYYLFGNALVQPEPDGESGNTILRPMTQARLKTKIRRILEDAPESTVSAVADDILHVDDLPFRKLRGLVTTPTFRSDFSLITEPGFDKKTLLFYAPDLQLRHFAFTTNATHADALKAFDLLHELLVDFPFSSEVDRLSYLAMLLTLFLRSAIPDVVPALLLDGNDRSVGKGLLSNINSLIVYGQECASMAAPANKNEFASKLDAILLSSSPFQVIDNIVGKFANDDFASVLTAMRRNVRIKGVSEVKNVPVLTLWVLNGNGVQLDSDMAERIIRCELHHEDARSRSQDDFLIQKKYKCDIPTLLRTQRAKYMQACLTIICAWVNAGAKRREKNLAMAKYGKWEGILGGIFDWLGKEKLLSNHKEHTAAVDTERQESTLFLTQIKLAFPLCAKVPFTASEVAANVFGKDEFGNNRSALRDFVPSELMIKNVGQPFVTALGRWLTIAATRQFGEHRVIKHVNKSTKSSMYTIETQVAREPKAASVGGMFEC